MKNNPHVPASRFLWLLVIIHLFFLWPLLQKGVPKSHDGELHIARFAAYSKAFTSGHIPPRWASDLNYGYGTPLFIFYYPLIGYVGSMVHAIGLTFQDSFKLLLAVAFVLSSVAFYAWMALLFPPVIAFVSALLYGLAPYHFLDLYIRGALPELTSFVFIPLVFYSLEKLYTTQRFSHALAGGIANALLILAHNAMSLLFTAVFVVYVAIRFGRSKKLLLLAGCLFAIGLLVSAFFWLPALVEQRYTHSTIFIGTKFKDHFPFLAQLIWSPWGLGTDVTKPGGLSPQIGLPHLAVVVLSLLVMKNVRKYRWLYWGSLSLFGVALFLTLQPSLFLWTSLPLLSKFEFPWRFTALSSFSCAVLSAVYFHTKRRHLLVAITILVVILTSFMYVKTPPFTVNDDQFYLTYRHSTDFGAVTPIWTSGDPYEYPAQPVEIISGNGTITYFSRQPTKHLMTIVSNQEVTVLDNTLYFPGWRVLVNGQKVPIQFQDPNHRGLITFRVPVGVSDIQVVFMESPVRFVSNILTIATISLILLYTLVRMIKYLKYRKAHTALIANTRKDQGSHFKNAS